MVRPSRSTVILAAVTALALAAAGWLTTGAALAADTPTPEPTPAPSSAPTDLATDAPADPQGDMPDPMETPEPSVTKPPVPQVPRETAASGAVAGNSFSSPVSWNALGLWPLVVLDNTTATVQSGEPTSVVGGGHIQRTVWIKWKAPRTGTVSLLAYGGVNPGDPSPDTGMNVYTGSKLSTLKRIASNDDQYFPIGGAPTEGNPPPRSSGILGVDVKKGTNYYIQVGSLIGTGGTSPAISDLTISVWGTDYNPGNDDFIRAQEIKTDSAVHLEASGILAGSTMEYWEPTFNDEVASKVRTGSIWYKWTAPATGTALFAACAPYHNAQGLAMTVFANYDKNAGVGFGDIAQIQDGFDYGDSSFCVNTPQPGGASVLATAHKDVTYFIEVAETLGGIDHDVQVFINTTYVTPFILSMSKTSGSKNGGTTVTLSGVNIAGTSLPTVWFGTKEATFVAGGPNFVTVKTPKQSHAGKVSVYLVRSGEDSNKVSFTYK